MRTVRSAGTRFCAICLSLAHIRIARVREFLQDGHAHPGDFDPLAHKLYEWNGVRRHGEIGLRPSASMDACRTSDGHAPAAAGIGFR